MVQGWIEQIKSIVSVSIVVRCGDQQVSTFIECNAINDRFPAKLEPHEFAGRSRFPDHELVPGALRCKPGVIVAPCRKLCAILARNTSGLPARCQIPYYIDHAFIPRTHVGNPLVMRAEVWPTRERLAWSGLQKQRRHSTGYI